MRQETDSYVVVTYFNSSQVNQAMRLFRSIQIAQTRTDGKQWKILDVHACTTAFRTEHDTKNSYWFADENRFRDKLHNISTVTSSKESAEWSNLIRLSQVADYFCPEAGNGGCGMYGYKIVFSDSVVLLGR